MIKSHHKKGKIALARSLVFLIVVGLFSYGCSLAHVSSAPEINFGKVRSIRIGVTSQGEVVSLLGKPFVKKGNAYIYENLYMAHNKRDTFRKELYVYFDDKGVVSKTLLGKAVLIRVNEFNTTLRFDAKNLYTYITTVLKFSVGETTLAQAEGLPYDFRRTDIYENGHLVEHVLVLEVRTVKATYEPLDELPFVFKGTGDTWLSRGNTSYILGFTKDGLLKSADELTGIYNSYEDGASNGGLVCMIACHK